MFASTFAELLWIAATIYLFFCSSINGRRIYNDRLNFGAWKLYLVLAVAKLDANMQLQKQHIMPKPQGFFINFLAEKASVVARSEVSFVTAKLVWLLRKQPNRIFSRRSKVVAANLCQQAYTSRWQPYWRNWFCWNEASTNKWRFAPHWPDNCVLPGLARPEQLCASYHHWPDNNSCVLPGLARSICVLPGLARPSCVLPGLARPRCVLEPQVPQGRGQGHEEIK